MLTINNANLYRVRYVDNQNGHSFQRIEEAHSQAEARAKFMQRVIDHTGSAFNATIKTISKA